MKSALGLVLLVAGFAAAENNMHARVGDLIERWIRGDKATRAGVVAETGALGEDAIAELYAQIGRERLDFRGGDPGVVFESAKDEPDQSKLVSMEFAFIRPGNKEAMPQRPEILGVEHRAILLAGCEKISAPRLTAYNGQRCHISLLNERSYVRTRENGKPVAGALQTGRIVDVRPKADGEFASLELRYVETRLDGKLASIKSGDGEIGLPLLNKRELAVTLRIKSGESLTLAIPGTEPLLLQVKATIIPAERLPRR
ncbi:MAG: hypothetical protein ACYTHK_02030 [Planctomycetota bacterium]|jgi:hypothetical protein